MVDDGKVFVAGTVSVPGNDTRTCQDCGSTIYPTAGSLKVAQEQARKIICVDCFKKIEDFEFGGFIHRGKMLDSETAEMMFRLLMAGIMANRI